MTAFFEAIGSFFTDFLFVPLHFLRDLELVNWWTANTLTWIFILICCAAFVYWLKQIALFDKTGEDKQDTTAHSFLS